MNFDPNRDPDQPEDEQAEDKFLEDEAEGADEAQDDAEAVEEPSQEDLAPMDAVDDGFGGGMPEREMPEMQGPPPSNFVPGAKTQSMAPGV